MIRGEQPLGISPELQKHMEAIRNKISQGIEEKENIIMPGAEVGIITLGTGGSLPSKYRNGLLYFPFHYMKSVYFSQCCRPSFGYHFGVTSYSIQAREHGARWLVISD